MDRKTNQFGAASLLQNERVKRVFFDEKWCYSVLDVLNLVGDWSNVAEYWRDLKHAEPSLARLGETVDIDGEPTEVLTAEGVLRLVQSVQTPKAERVRQWLAKTGKQRLDETENPELAMVRVRSDYERKGYDRRWVDKRLRGMSARQELTSEWARRGATDSEQYRALTNRLMEAAFGMTVEEYRRHKYLTGTTQNLRDHMSDMELVLTMLGETAATALHRGHGSRGFEELLEDVRQAGEVAAATRAALAERVQRSAA
jgi:DNA-damage-inducible protein D